MSGYIRGSIYKSDFDSRQNTREYLQMGKEVKEERNRDQLRKYVRGGEEGDCKDIDGCDNNSE